MSDSIHTLQEFMFQTKGILYILAIGYLLGFVCFWKFIIKDRKGGDRR